MLGFRDSKVEEDEMRWILAMTLALTWACSSPASPPDDAEDADMSEDVVDEDTQALPAFVADAEPQGAALYVNVDTSDSEAPTAIVWAVRLGPVFGVAFHLEIDGEAVSASAPVAELFLGPGSVGEAAYMAVLAADDEVELGAVRRGPDAGEVVVDEPVVVAIIPLTIDATGTSRLDLTDAQVRRADGSFTPVSVAGGLLTTGGER